MESKGNDHCFWSSPLSYFKCQKPDPNPVPVPLLAVQASESLDSRALCGFRARGATQSSGGGGASSEGGAHQKHFG